MAGQAPEVIRRRAGRASTRRRARVERWSANPTSAQLVENTCSVGGEVEGENRLAIGHCCFAPIAEDGCRFQHPAVLQHVRASVIQTVQQRTQLFEAAGDTGKELPAGTLTQNLDGERRPVVP